MSLPEYRIIFDLDHESGKPQAIRMERMNAGESIERGRGRYVAELPKGMICGEHGRDNPILK
jgi:hypothetical protein